MFLSCAASIGLADPRRAECPSMRTHFVCGLVCEILRFPLSQQRYAANEKYRSEPNPEQAALESAHRPSAAIASPAKVDKADRLGRRASTT